MGHYHGWEKKERHHHISIIEQSINAQVNLSMLKLKREL